MHEVDTTGFILTKLDGDARGGAALSMTAVTGRPVFFVGTGEKVDDLEPFYPDRMAGRILGMGDVLTLIEKAQDTVDQEAAAKAAEQMLCRDSSTSRTSSGSSARCGSSVRSRTC